MDEDDSESLHETVDNHIDEDEFIKEIENLRLKENSDSARKENDPEESAGKENSSDDEENDSYDSDPAQDDTISLDDEDEDEEPIIECITKSTMRRKL
jgi:hypothetical protein